MKILCMKVNPCVEEGELPKAVQKALCQVGYSVMNIRSYRDGFGTSKTKTVNSVSNFRSAWNMMQDSIPEDSWSAEISSWQIVSGISEANTFYVSSFREAVGRRLI